jgi:uncharacterized membrane protein (DUF485 family)
MPISRSEHITQNPKFQQLTTARSRFAWLLSVVVLLIWYGYMMIVAFNPKLLAIPLFSGSVTTIGVPIGAAIIIVSWLLTGVYIRRANREFDVLAEELIQESHK